MLLTPMATAFLMTRTVAPTMRARPNQLYGTMIMMLMDMVQARPISTVTFAHSPQARQQTARTAMTATAPSIRARLKPATAWTITAMVQAMKAVQFAETALLSLANSVMAEHVAHQRAHLLHQLLPAGQESEYAILKNSAQVLVLHVQLIL
jgi:hypothetical protein